MIFNYVHQETLFTKVHQFMYLKWYKIEKNVNKNVAKIRSPFF